MKTLLVTLLLSCTFLSFGNDEKQDVKKTSIEYVYVCNGPSATKYHKTKNCRGLSRCSTNIEKISKSDAVKKGRSACKICYKY